MGLRSDGGALTCCHWAYAPAAESPSDAVTAEAARQLREYFAGRLREFSLPLAPAGTPFQLRVWEELARIPYGQTITYGELARRIGRPGACRAVAGACGANPLAIIIPCHRVVAANGIGGFAASLEAKSRLIALERESAG